MIGSPSPSRSKAIGVPSRDNALCSVVMEFSLGQNWTVQY
jgi:hypothetical protein